MSSYVDLSLHDWNITANGFNGVLHFTPVSDLDRRLNGGTAFGDTISDITYNAQDNVPSAGPWIRFTRNNQWFTQVYSGAVVQSQDGVMLLGTFTHEPGYAEGTSWFWCTDSY